ncbi:hypothetical protein BC940DRAFT_335907 [Gongronella butleri]|nr:hypothetical protein BC940DRAFT_335907 [Gongronella butleri]
MDHRRGWIVGTLVSAHQRESKEATCNEDHATGISLFVEGNFKGDMKNVTSANECVNVADGTWRSVQIEGEDHLCEIYGLEDCTGLKATASGTKDQDLAGYTIRSIRCECMVEPEGNCHGNKKPSSVWLHEKPMFLGKEQLVKSADECVDVDGANWKSARASGNYECTVCSRAGCKGTESEINVVGAAHLSFTVKSLQCPCT